MPNLYHYQSKNNLDISEKKAQTKSAQNIPVKQVKAQPHKK